MSTDLMIYGDIGENWWSGDGITEVSVRDELVNLDQDAAMHTVHINSLGGNVNTGLTIMNLFRAHAGQMKAANPEFKLRMICEGFAMSIASVIFMAGDERVVALGGILMIHDAWNGCYGNAAEMRKQADTLDLMSQNIADVYAALCTPAAKDATARDAAYYRALMKDETYMVGSEAVDKGLATSLDMALTASASDKSLSPEVMKGRYVEMMTAGYKKRTYTKPTAAKSLVDAKAAKARLDALLATLKS